MKVKVEMAESSVSVKMEGENEIYKWRTLKIWDTSEVAVSALNMVYSTVSDRRRHSSGCTSCWPTRQRGTQSGHLPHECEII